MGILAVYHMSEREESKRSRNKNRNIMLLIVHFTK